MIELGLALALELGDDSLRQGLAELDSPLVERVDLPDRSLGEDAVLVKRHQRPQHGRSEAFGEDDVRRPVAFERAMRYEEVGDALRP